MSVPFTGGWFWQRAKCQHDTCVKYHACRRSSSVYSTSKKSDGAWRSCREAWRSQPTALISSPHGWRFSFSPARTTMGGTTIARCASIHMLSALYMASCMHATVWLCSDLAVRRGTHQRRIMSTPHIQCRPAERKAIMVIRSLNISESQQAEHAQQWHRWRQRRAALDKRWDSLLSMA